MGQQTNIEWTDHTWNPWWGCTKVSPACDHCYAETLAKRYGFKIWGQDAGRRLFGDKHWHEPFRWNDSAEREGIRRKVFCGSMCDVMEEGEGLDRLRGDLWQVIQSTPWLDWQLLTKRPQNYKRMLPSRWLENPPGNVWLGATVESADYLWRAVELLNLPRAFPVRFVSYEPALGPLDFSSVTVDVCIRANILIRWAEHPFGSMLTPATRIDWVIAGGESGPGARPMKAEWVQVVRDQCAIARVPFFFKQWGDWLPADQDGAERNGHTILNCSGEPIRVGKKAAGALLDGVEWKQFPSAAGLPVVSTISKASIPQKAEKP